MTYSAVEIANAALDMGEVDEALATLDAHLAEAPDDQAALELRLQILARIPGREADALYHYEQLLPRQWINSGIDTLLAMARVFEQVGDFLAVRSMFKSAVEIEDRPDIRLAFAPFFLNSQPQRLLEILGSLSDSPAVDTWRGDAHAALGQTDAAIAAYQRAIAALPDDPVYVPTRAALKEKILRLSESVNEMLGYPPEARLLILNADDLGMGHAINEAIFRSMTEGVVRSTSLMPPCPWTLHAIRHLQAHPELPFGVHLTVLNDQKDYRWRPLSPVDRVPSLVDEAGFFHPLDAMNLFLEQARIDELEIEFRAQIDFILRANIAPTHLDWHCLHSGGRQDIFEMTFRLAREFGFVLRTDDRLNMRALQSEQLPTADHPLMDSYNVPVQDKSQQYIEMMRALPAGLTEWAVHPAIGDAEMQAIEPESWQIRASDFDFFMSREARDVIQQEGIILLDYRTLLPLWKTKPGL